MGVELLPSLVHYCCHCRPVSGGLNDMEDAMGRLNIKKLGALDQEAFMGVVCLETRVLVSSCLGGVGGH